MSQLGDLLKTERENRGIRLTDIASVTKIPLTHLKLIEEGQWDHLPPKPFIKGFLTSYARFVGLDPAQIYSLYLAEIQVPVEAPVSPSEASPEAAPLPAAEVIADPKVLRIKPVAMGVSTVVGLLLSVWLIRLGKPEAVPPSVAAVTEPGSVIAPAGSETSPRELASNAQAPKAEEPKAESVPVAVPPAPSPSSAETGSHELQVTSKERTWIKIVIDEAPPVEYFLGPSEKTKYTAKEKIKLVLGNSAGAEVLHNGAPAEGVKFQGTIRSYIFPAQAKFPQDKPARRLTEEELPEESDSAPGEFILE